MTPEQIVKVSEVYETMLRRVGTRPEEVDKDLVYPGVNKACRHALWMLPQIREFATTGHVAKAERWICFVQGVVWNAGFFSINEMRDHNRSVESGTVGGELQSPGDDSDSGAGAKDD